jgi:hypothetical protein
LQVGKRNNLRNHQKIGVSYSSIPLWGKAELRQNDYTYPSVGYVSDYHSFTMLFNKLPRGSYHLFYTSVFGDSFTDTVNLNRNRKISYPDDLVNYYTKTDIDDFSADELASGDTLQIFYETSGCFHAYEQLFQFVFNTSDSTFREFQTNVFKTEIVGSFSMSNFRKFISQGKNYHGRMGCTTVENYTLRIKGKRKIALINDGSCKWYGMRKLTADNF